MPEAVSIADQWVGRVKNLASRGLGWATSHPRAALGLGVAAAGALFLSNRDRREHAGRALTGGLAATMVLGAAAAVMPMGGKLLGKSLAWAGRKAGTRLVRAEKAWTEAHAAGQGWYHAFAGSPNSWGRSPMLMAATGATVGSIFGGITRGDPIGGALAGAGFGVAGSAALRGYSSYSRMGKFRRTLAIAGMSTAIFVGGRARNGVAPAEEESGPSLLSGPSGVHDRMDTMNAQGDLVFGLHSRRH